MTLTQDEIRSVWKTAGATALAVLLFGCSGQMGGLVHSPDGQSSGRAKFSYQDNGFGSGTITATMPDGEIFEGTYREVKARTRTHGYVQTDTGLTPVYGTGYTDTDQYNAVLFSNRNRSMRCQFQGDFLSGVGTCQVSDGRIVDVQWSQ